MCDNLLVTLRKNVTTHNLGNIVLHNATKNFNESDFNG